MNKRTVKIIGLVLLVWFSKTLTAQTKIEGKVIGGYQVNLFLTEHFGDDSKIVDTIALDNNGHFVYQFNDDMAKGLYRLYFPHDDFLDLMLGFEDVKFQTLAANPMQSLIIQAGEQNEAFHDFQVLLNDNFYSKKMLEEFVRSYPNDDKALKAVKRQLIKAKQKEQKSLNEIRKQHPESFVSSYLDFLYKQDKSEFLSTSLTAKHQWFREKNWLDSTLVNSDAFSKSVIDFLKLYDAQSATRVSQDMRMQKAIDDLFSIIPRKSPAFDFAFLYLINGLEQYEMESVIMHMVENYSESCSQTEGKLTNRVDFYKHFYKGAIIPDFVLPDLQGEPHQFYNETGEYTLLFFWATWCNHCQQMNVALREMYPKLKEKDITVISVSLDSDSEELQTYLSEQQFPWSVYSDFLSWDSPIVKQFYLYATPTMFLMDSKHRLIGKPLSLNQLVYMLSQL